MLSRRFALCLPMPGMTRTFMGARKAASLPGYTTVSPFGLSRSEAIFATVLQLATPMEQVMPSSATCSWMRVAMDTGSSPVKRPGVTSRNASSIETCSSRGDSA